jgi:hypothetical protein
VLAPTSLSVLFHDVYLGQISPFLCHLRHIYRNQNSYHNFEHALDVLQATHTFLTTAGVVPPVSILKEGDDRMWRPDKFDKDSLASSLGAEDVFMLYVAAIGHDVGHPGFTNVFMVSHSRALMLCHLNARTAEKCKNATVYNIR